MILKYAWRLFHKIHRRMENAYVLSSLAQRGRDVVVAAGAQMTDRMVFLGNDVYIGENALFLCKNAPVQVGDHVMFGPRVTIITGDHRIDCAGKYMTEVTEAEKKPENDLPVVLQGDNWVGANATILKGVTVGKGAVIAAGAVVTKDVPPYACVAGVPAHVIRYRFSEEELKDHCALLNKRSDQKASNRVV